VAEALLQGLGARIRSRRTGRGWTQAELCRRAGISHRFLVQVESGSGNPSLMRLSELATALECSLVSLLGGLGGSTDELDRLVVLAGEMSPERRRLLLNTAGGSGRKVALVGLRGAGKSTIGARVAAALSWDFVELDGYIREQAGMPLRELFEYHGVERYRALRLEALESVLAASGDAVIEVGGSIVMDQEAYARLRASSETVWLQATPEEHLRRVKEQGDTRPMAGREDPLGELRGILKQRRPLYALSRFRLDTVEHGLRGSVERLVGLIGVA
jgi:XRE family transcriptional regulator, aerobic/anaerobic benzoate catabolism transcriptional regulator